MKNKLVLNSVEDAEIISVRLDPDRFPIAYANKVECLMLSGLSEEEAKKEAMMPIDLELYYEVGVGLMMNPKLQLRGLRTWKGRLNVVIMCV